MVNDRRHFSRTNHFASPRFFLIPHDDSNLGHLQNTYGCYEKNSFVIRTVRWNSNTRFWRWWKPLLLIWLLASDLHVTIPIHNFNILWVLARRVNILCNKIVLLSKVISNTNLNHSLLVLFAFFWYPHSNHLRLNKQYSAGLKFKSHPMLVSPL